MKITREEWAPHQAWENEWWGDCLNTFGEETKQITYGHRMGLINQPRGETWPSYDLKGQSVLDLGGGPVSMLLKCYNGKPGGLTVVDPGAYPAWTMERYKTAGIRYVQEPAEDFSDPFRIYDLCLMYNVLQHTIDPEAIIRVAQRQSKLIRIFEWVEVGENVMGHPHNLHAADLDAWLDGFGTVAQINENGCRGLCYYGTFEGSKL